MQRLFSHLSFSSVVTGTRDVLEWKVSSSECGNYHEISLTPLLTLLSADLFTPLRNQLRDMKDSLPASPAPSHSEFRFLRTSTDTESRLAVIGGGWCHVTTELISDWSRSESVRSVSSVGSVMSKHPHHSLATSRN